MKTNKIIKNSQNRNLTKGEKMKFFSEFSNKIIWAIVSVLLIGVGYLAILNIWLKPKSKPVMVSTPNPTITNTPKTQQTKEDLISALAKAEEIEVINPQELVQGGIHKIHAGLTPERSTSYETVLTQEFKFREVNKSQEISGFFEVPKTGYYLFKVFGTKPELGNTDTRLRLRINGATIRNEKESVYLQKGWHNLNFQVIYHPHLGWPNLSDFLVFKDVNLKSRRTEEKTFKTIELWSVAE